MLGPSSAGPVFDTMKDVPAATLASWRAQTTTLLLLLPGIFQLSHPDSGTETTGQLGQSCTQQHALQPTACKLSMLDPLSSCVGEAQGSGHWVLDTSVVHLTGQQAR